MEKVFISLIFIVLIQSRFGIFSAIRISNKPVSTYEAPLSQGPDPALKKEVFDILHSKCNVCHRKKNPFKIFSLKNMDKHAPKIYKQVFVYRRMPKGDQIKLTDQEYQTLSDWLKSKNIK